MATFESSPFPVGALRTRYRRADVELHRVDQAVPSYEGRLFLNRPDADRDTPLDVAQGYVGSFFIFGKGECWGDDEDHCDPPTGRKFDRRRPQTRYAKVRVRIPDGVLDQALGEADTAVVNIVAVLPGEPAERHAPESVLRFERIAIVTYS